MHKALLIVAFGLLACSDDKPNVAPRQDAGADTGLDDGAAPDATDASGDVLLSSPSLDCDGLDPSYCALPWPSNAFLLADPARATGRTLTFGATTLPANNVGKHIDPGPYTQMDGYGLSAPAIALFPHVDTTGLADEYSVARSMDADAKVLLFEAGASLTRIPYFVDHDLWTDDPSKRTLIVRPAVVLKPATRYVVAFRGLTTPSGTPIPRSDAFELVVQGKASSDPNLAWRAERLEGTLRDLEAHGVTRQSLTLAWDWNTASEDALHGPMLSMRDEMLDAMPDGPPLTITQTEEFTETQNAEVAVRFKGTFEVPDFVEVDGDLKTLRRNGAGKPIAQGSRTAEFWVNVPRSALTGDPHGLVHYGHGLFGTGNQTNSGFNGQIGNTYQYIFYGASLWGMSDVQGSGDAFRMVFDLSLFPALGHQLHQGMLEWILLARAMKKRFGNLPEVTSRGIQVAPEAHYYSGISQGGIFGPTFVALSPDVQFGHSGVPGHSYAMLLHRSVDFGPFFAVLRATYPDPVDQVLALHTVQLLWDATDPVSYVWNLSARPIDGSAGNAMIWAPAKGDFQVSVVQNETLARTPELGVALMANYDTQRQPDLIQPTSYPHQGSAVVLYDFEKSPNGYAFRNPWPTAGNRPPRRGSQDACPTQCPAGRDVDGTLYSCCDGACCFDPHELPRREPHHNAQMIHFFESSGQVVDVCGGDACTPQ